MPTESIAPSLPPPPPSTGTGLIKCSHCGGSGLPSSSYIPTARNAGSDIVDDDAERVCAACWTIEEDGDERLERDLATAQREHDMGGEMVDGLGLGLRGMSLDAGPTLSDGLLSADVDNTPPSIPSSQVYAEPVLIPSHPPSYNTPDHPSHAHSLPAQHTRPWTTQPAGRISPISEERRSSPSVPSKSGDEDRPWNPLLDVTTTRVSNLGRGALYPGSVFKGTQTSGRSAYDVEVRFVDVNFPESSVSGYLSISHLTDTHPHLTTFFTGEIIGPKYGFITGPRFGATEHDDMRHWGRFEQFRRPATRADMVRPDLLFRDPVSRPMATVGMGGIGMAKEHGPGAERDFVFLRIKERFLVPDHTVRDISGASFAGFYFAMIDLNPSSASSELSPTSPTIPKSPPLPHSPLPPPSTTTSQYYPTPTPPTHARRQSSGPPHQPGIMLPPFPPPPTTRRMSSSGPRSPGWENGPVPAGSASGTGTRRRRESSGRAERVEREPQREATIRGYYFHSLNQEPFQELFLTHVPNRSSGTFEMR